MGLECSSSPPDPKRPRFMANPYLRSPDVLFQRSLVKFKVKSIKNIYWPTSDSLHSVCLAYTHPERKYLASELYVSQESSPGWGTL